MYTVLDEKMRLQMHCPGIPMNLLLGKVLHKMRHRLPLFTQKLKLLCLSCYNRVRLLVKRNKGTIMELSN